MENSITYQNSLTRRQIKVAKIIATKQQKIKAAYTKENITNFNRNISKVEFIR